MAIFIIIVITAWCNRTLGGEKQIAEYAEVCRVIDTVSMDTPENRLFVLMLTTETNRRLAIAKYRCQSGWWGIYVNDDYASLEYIK